MALLTFALKSNAQSITPDIINATGDSFTKDNVTYEWSVGELALIESIEIAKSIITNGLLQATNISLYYNVESPVFPTNLLSPNGDGKNDYWIVKDIEKFPDNEVTVFDRAGRTVYTKKGYSNDWGGTLRGAPLSEDTYYYIIDLGMGKPKVKGFITIVRDKR